jgi:hypothetical protein
MKAKRAIFPEARGFYPSIFCDAGFIAFLTAVFSGWDAWKLHASWPAAVLIVVLPTVTALCLGFALFAWNTCRIVRHFPKASASATRWSVWRN